MTIALAAALLALQQAPAEPPTHSLLVRGPMLLAEYQLRPVRQLPLYAGIRAGVPLELVALRQAGLRATMSIEATAIAGLGLDLRGVQLSAALGFGYGQRTQVPEPGPAGWYDTTRLTVTVGAEIRRFSLALEVVTTDALYGGRLAPFDFSGFGPGLRLLFGYRLLAIG